MAARRFSDETENLVKESNFRTGRSDNRSSDDESAIEEELQLLEAIYIHELTIERSDTSGFPDVVSLLLHPATADDPDKQYVCLTLIFNLNDQYPNEVPGIEIKNARGLADEEISGLLNRLKEHANRNSGTPILYELIEISKELLTDSNIPHCPCAVCLEYFHSDSEFSKTPCYHYLHKHCLHRYITFWRQQTEEDDNQLQILPHIDKDKNKEVLCPTCRQPITSCVDEILEIPLTEPEVDDAVYERTDDIIEMQKQMAKLFAKQKAKGGIIDVEKQSKMYLVQEGEMVSLAVPVAEEPKLTVSESSTRTEPKTDTHKNRGYHRSRFKNDRSFHNRKYFTRNDHDSWRDEGPPDGRRRDKHDCAKETSSGNKDNQSDKKQGNSYTGSDKLVKNDDVDSHREMNEKSEITFVSRKRNPDSKSLTPRDFRKIEQLPANKAPYRGRGGRRPATRGGRGYVNSRNRDSNKIHDNELSRPSSHTRGRGRGNRSRGTRSTDFKSTSINDKAESS